MLVLLVTFAITVPAGAPAEQAAQPSAVEAGRLDAGQNHTCAVLESGRVRCWGYGQNGQLGYADTRTIGDDEVPSSAGPVDLGEGRTATALSAGWNHTCAVLDDGSVRCWGFGANGRLGYVNLNIAVGDDETPGSLAPVSLGAGRTATAITAGGGHTCALLDDRSVRCWGFGGGGAREIGGQLGYGNTNNIGDDETPASAGPVKLGPGRTAMAITAGQDHTCALLDDGNVRCWGQGTGGQLGYGNQDRIGDTETPDTVGPVNLGPGRTAKAISAGDVHTCGVLDDGSVLCWGIGASGQLGYGNTQNVGDNELPGTVGPVNLGPGRTARAISAGDVHTCAVLDNGSVRCWGSGANGRLGYGNLTRIGDDETPGSVGPVALGPGRTATAITAGFHHTCARLDDGNVRCWGYGLFGRLGYANELDVGDDETPGSVGPVRLGPAVSTIDDGSPAGSYPLEPDTGLQAQAARLRGLRGCLARVKRHTRREIRRARRLSGSRRARARRHARGHRSKLRQRCLKRYGRTPGAVRGLKAQAVSETKIVLTFNAAGTDGARPPAARTYVVKQSRRPIRGASGFRRAQTLCDGSCRFPNTIRVGSVLSLTVLELRPHTTYYYAVGARDNVSRRVGPRSTAVRVRTR